VVKDTETRINFLFVAKLLNFSRYGWHLFEKQTNATFIKGQKTMIVVLN